MKFKSSVLLFFSSVYLSSVSVAALRPPQSDWKEVGKDSGITIFRKEDTGQVMAFKGEGTLNASAGKLVHLLRDSNGRQKWAKRIKLSEVVQEDTTYDRIEHLATSAPWPIKDRDFVYRMSVKADRGNKRVVFDVHSVYKPGIIETKEAVRAHIYSCRFELYPQKDSQTTRFILEIYADPRGSLPRWLVKIGQKDGAIKFLKNVAAAASGANVPEDPIVKNLERS